MNGGCVFTSMTTDSKGTRYRFFDAVREVAFIGEQPPFVVSVAALRWSALASRLCRRGLDTTTDLEWQP